MKAANAVKRYTRLEGVELGEHRLNSMKVKVGGLWYDVPKSVIHRTTKNVGSNDADEIVVEEWYAKQKGWV